MKRYSLLLFSVIISSIRNHSPIILPKYSDPTDDNLIPDVYFYKIKVDATSMTFIKTNKMIFTR
jgi:hypothetical protein